jgi:uncharacterized membrane protein YedE/YeeE
MTNTEQSSPGWSPYLAGALVGLLAIASVLVTTLLMGKSNYLGASTTFVRAAGEIFNVIDPEYVADNVYFTRTKIKIDWQFMLVIGIFLGALISSKLDKSFKLEGSPPIWRDRFGDSPWVRAVGSILGGIIAMIGARMASGCPSGHGLSGMMQLSLSSFVALPIFFLFGVIVANLLFKRN